jgi:hypothetical protein
MQSNEEKLKEYLAKCYKLIQDIYSEASSGNVNLKAIEDFELFNGFEIEKLIH